MTQRYFTASINKINLFTSDFLGGKCILLMNIRAQHNTLIKIHICYLPAARPLLKKCFSEVSEAARGRRPREYFLARTDPNGK